MKSFVRILSIYSFLSAFPIEIKVKNTFSSLYSPIKLYNIKNIVISTIIFLAFCWCIFKKLSHEPVSIQQLAVAVAKILVTITLMSVIFVKRGKVAQFLNGLQRIEDEFIALNVLLSHRYLNIYIYN